MTQKRILITGGRGLLAGRLAMHLSLNSEYLVTLASRENFLLNAKNTILKTLDWDDEKSLFKVCKGQDVVIHTAGANADECGKNWELGKKINVELVERLFEAIEPQGVTQFIYPSTMHIYGKVTGTINENTKSEPNSNYAETKLLAEALIESKARKKNISASILRLSNSFGVPIGMHCNCWGLVVQHMCKQLAEYDNIKLTSNGPVMRNFITLTDVCRAFQFVIGYDQTKFAKTDIFNLGGSLNIPVTQMANFVEIVHRNSSVPSEQMLLMKNELTHRHPFLNYQSLKFSAKGFHALNNYQCEISNLLNFCYQNFPRKGSTV